MKKIEDSLTKNWRFWRDDKGCRQFMAIFKEKTMKKTSTSELKKILSSDSDIIDTEIEKVVTDSRKIEKNALFVAIKGEKFDGHNFVAKALEEGCALAVVEHLVGNAPANRQLVVEDTLEAYGKLGAYNRESFKGKIIGLTGSAGKTTTKEEIKYLLSSFGKVYATGGNHNNHIGVPQTLLEMDMSADYAVIEMGMSSKGEISRLTSYVKPDVALVTNVYPMHIEFFESFEGIAEAKAEIFEGLPKNGTAIINEDTNFANILEKRAREHVKNVVFFGKNNHFDGKLELSEDGEIQRYNAWAALKVAEVLGLDCQKAADKLKDFGALDGRGKKHIVNLTKGGQFMLIDDSYSGQPEAMRIAIKSLDKMECRGRKIAVLGKMAELGDFSKKEHIAVGKVLADTNIDIVVGVKPETKDILAQLPERVEQYYFDNKDGLAEFLLNKLLQNGDILLIKGARYSSELYKVTDELLKGL